MVQAAQNGVERHVSSSDAAECSAHREAVHGFEHAAAAVNATVTLDEVPEPVHGVINALDTRKWILTFKDATTGHRQ